MRFIDLFAGVGGFRRGMESAGHECVGFCEIDKYAVMSYTAMHLATDAQLDYLQSLPFRQRQKEILKEEYRNGEWYASDINTIRADDIPDAECWCFGFPCQDISVAGRQEGFTGDRSSLLFTVLRLLREKGDGKPRWLFCENVKNLLSINAGWDFARVLFEMDDIGYDVEWQVIDSQHHGVPQHRERIFLVGHLRGTCTGQVFPIPEPIGQDQIHGVAQVGMCQSDRHNPNQWRVYDPSGIAPTLTGSMGGGQTAPHHNGGG